MERVNPAATRSTHDAVAWIDHELMNIKAADARTNARGREIHNFHATDDEALHRMLNAMQPGTYVQPHRHAEPPKAEAIIVLRGAVGVVIFDDLGKVQTDQIRRLDATGPTVGIDIRPGIWHTFVALEDDTILYEVKPGPYTPISDKDFPPWAPPPQSDKAPVFLSMLENHFKKASHEDTGKP